MSQGDRRSAKVWRRGMKSNDERIKTLEKFNIIGRKKTTCRGGITLAADGGIRRARHSRSVVCNSCSDSADNLGDILLSRRRRVSFLVYSYVQGCGYGALPVLRRGILSHAGQESSALQKMRQGQLQGIKQNKNQPPQGFFLAAVCYTIIYFKYILFYAYLILCLRLP